MQKPPRTNPKAQQAPRLSGAHVAQKASPAPTSGPMGRYLIPIPKVTMHESTSQEASRISGPVHGNPKREATVITQPSPRTTRSGTCLGNTGHSSGHSVPSHVYNHTWGLGHQQKLAQWSIKSAYQDTDTLVLGTSNIAKITEKPNHQIELQSFPGGQFPHMLHLLERLNLQTSPKNVVIAMGINDAASKSQLGQLQREVLATVNEAQRKFPESHLAFALVHHDQSMQGRALERIQEINRALETQATKVQILSRIPQSKFRLKSQNQNEVHWSPDTANRILLHWTSQLKN